MDVVYIEEKKSDDGDIWSKDLEKHSFGQFSFSVVQAKEAIEDYSQVETGAEALYVGVYDGRGGDRAAKYVQHRLFDNFIRKFIFLLFLFPSDFTN